MSKIYLAEIGDSNSNDDPGYIITVGTYTSYEGALLGIQDRIKENYFASGSYYTTQDVPDDELESYNTQVNTAEELDLWCEKFDNICYPDRKLHQEGGFTTWFDFNHMYDESPNTWGWRITEIQLK